MYILSRIVSSLFVGSGTLILAWQFGFMCALGVGLVVGGAVIYIMGIRKSFGDSAPD